MRLATPSYEGDTGLFRLSSAYVLPKGKAAFSLFRDNYDRDPKGIDFSIARVERGLRRHGQARDLRPDRPPEPDEGPLRRRSPASTTTCPSRAPRAGRRASATSSWALKYAFLDDYRGRRRGPRPQGRHQVRHRRRAEGPGHRHHRRGGRPRPLQEPQLQGRPARLGGLPLRERPGRPQHRQRLQVGLRLQPPGLREVQPAGRGHRPVLQRRRVLPDEPGGPDRGPRDLAQAGPLHPAGRVLRPQLRPSWQRRQLEQEAGQADRDRLSPGDALLRGLHAASAASAAGQPAPHRVPQLPEGQPARG